MSPSSSAMPDQQKILLKIRKCLALANSPGAEIGEAAAALRNAQAMMRKYGLTDDDVSLADIREVLVTASGSVRLQEWEVHLVECIIGTFGIRALLRAGEHVVSTAEYCAPGKRPRHRVHRKRGRVVFIGPENRAVVAGYAYEALRRQLRRARIEHRTARLARGAALEAFCVGWVMGVRAKLKAIAIPFAFDPRTNAYIASEYGETSPAEVNELDFDGHGSSMLHGYNAAADAVLSAGVGGSAAAGGGIPLESDQARLTQWPSTGAARNTRR